MKKFYEVYRYEINAMDGRPAGAKRVAIVESYDKAIEIANQIPFNITTKGGKVVEVSTDYSGIIITDTIVYETKQEIKKETYFVYDNIDKARKNPVAVFENFWEAQNYIDKNTGFIVKNNRRISTVRKAKNF